MSKWQVSRFYSALMRNMGFKSHATLPFVALELSQKAKVGLATKCESPSFLEREQLIVIMKAVFWMCEDRLVRKTVKVHLRVHFFMLLPFSFVGPDQPRY